MPRRHTAQIQLRRPQTADAVHHRAAALLARAQLAERGDFDVVVVALAVAAPFDRYEAVTQAADWLGLS